MSVILAISLSFNTAFLRNLGNIREAQDSVRALYAADGGVEHCLYEARTGQDAVGDVFERPELQNQEYVYELPPDRSGRSATFKVTNVEASAAQFSENESIDDCLKLNGDSALGVRSTGTFRSANRSLEISY